MEVVVLLDPSYENTGYAVLPYLHHNDVRHVMYSGSIRCVNAHRSQRERAYEIGAGLARLLEMLTGHGHRPVFVGIEEPIYHGKRNACKSLDRLNGALGEKIYERIPYIRVYDMEVKEWRDALGFKAPTKTKDMPAALVKERLKAALVELAQQLFPNVVFATADAAEAALMGRRLLMHLDGTRPFAARAKRKKSTATTSSPALNPCEPSSGKRAASSRRRK